MLAFCTEINYLYNIYKQEPETIELGNEVGSTARHQKKDTFQYIPLEDGLRALLKNQEISDEVYITFNMSYTPLSLYL